MNSRHRRLATTLDHSQHFVETRLFGHRGEFGDIGTGYKGAPLAVDHHSSGTVVSLCLFNPCFQAQAYTVAQGIDRGIIQSQNSDSLFHAVINHIC